MKPLNDRERVLTVAREVLAGGRASWLPEQYQREPGWCLGFTHALVDRALGEPWPLFKAAAKVWTKAGRWMPWASDVAEAARAEGQAYSDLHPGALVYWDWRGNDGKNYGHIAVFLGEVSYRGDAPVPRILENTYAHRGVGVLDPARPVRLTPLAQAGTPDLIIAPSRAVLMADRAAYAAGKR